MTLGELRDKLADISDETELDTDVYIQIDGYTCKLVKNVFVDFDEGDIVIQ